MNRLLVEIAFLEKLIEEYLTERWTFDAAGIIDDLEDKLIAKRKEYNILDRNFINSAVPENLRAKPGGGRGNP